MSTLGSPPADLDGFPTWQLTPDRPLFRIHRAHRTPWWFASGGHGRFDLSSPRGTCYLAEHPVGAFLEALQKAGIVIEPEEIRERRISRLFVPTEMSLAGCTHSLARGYGLTGEVRTWSGEEGRRRTQEWAGAFARAGFAGIRYLLRHDTSQRQGGIALFGVAGEATWPVDSTDALEADLVLEVTRRFGIRVATFD